MIFTNIEEKKPTETGWYVCRVIDRKGNVSYRVDQYLHPDVYEEKHIGIVDGFQLDFGSLEKTDAYSKLTDNYVSHIIKFSKSGSYYISQLTIDGNDLTLKIHEKVGLTTTEPENPKIYMIPIVCTYDSPESMTDFTSIAKIYKFEGNDELQVAFDINDPLRKIINDCNCMDLKKYFEKYFKFEILRIYNHIYNTDD